MLNTLFQRKTTLVITLTNPSPKTTFLQYDHGRHPHQGLEVKMEYLGKHRHPLQQQPLEDYKPHAQWRHNTKLQYLPKANYAKIAGEAPWDPCEGH